MKKGDMVRKVFKFVLWISMVFVVFGIYFYSNKYLDFNDFGVVRVGRVVVMMVVISYDYFIFLKSVFYGLEEYL